MKILIPILLTFAIIFVATGGCKKKGSNSITGGGKGGATVLNITPEFANFFIDTFIVYIKYGTHDAPADGIYDDSTCVTVVNDTPVASFTGLTVGLYYMYGVGYHSTGGHPPNLKGSQIATIEQDGTTNNLYMPIDPYIPPSPYIPICRSEFFRRSLFSAYAYEQQVVLE